MELAKEGCDVVIASRTQSALDEAAKEIEDITGRKIIPMALDVTSREQVDGVMAEAVKQLGGLDILVNSASLPGGSPSAVGPIDGLDENELLSDFDTKYVGAFRCARAAIPFLKEQPWGRIINITSVAVKQPIDGLILSNTVRAAVTGFAKTLANEVAPDGITVNNVMPGFTRTERLDGLAENSSATQGITEEEAFARWAGQSPMGRIGEPKEFAALVAFLASERASYITGTSIPVDGGFIQSLL